MRIALKVFALSEICMHGYCVALRVFAHPQILCQRSKSEPLGACASTCMHTEHVLGCISCVSMHAQACTCACKGAHTHTRYRLKSSEFCPGKSLISSLLLRSCRWDLSKCGGPPHYAMAMHANFRKCKDLQDYAHCAALKRPTSAQRKCVALAVHTKRRLRWPWTLTRCICCTAKPLYAHSH